MEKFRGKRTMEEVGDSPYKRQSVQRSRLRRVRLPGYDEMVLREPALKKTTKEADMATIHRPKLVAGLVRTSSVFQRLVHEFQKP